MKKKVLIIDDSQHAADMITAALTATGYEATAVLRFEDAVKVVQASVPQLVLIDVVMPDISGFEACEKIKKITVDHPPRIIIMTGKLDAIDPIRARKMGADDFVVKTSDMEAIVKAVKELIG